MLSPSGLYVSVDSPKPKQPKNHSQTMSTMATSNDFPESEAGDHVALLAEPEEEPEEPFLGIFRSRGKRSAAQYSAVLLVNPVPRQSTRFPRMEGGRKLAILQHVWCQGMWLSLVQKRKSGFTEYHILRVKPLSETLLVPAELAMGRDIEEKKAQGIPVIETFSPCCLRWTCCRRCC